jgi:hypothetical protein
MLLDLMECCNRYAIHDAMYMYFVTFYFYLTTIRVKGNSGMWYTILLSASKTLLTQILLKYLLICICLYIQFISKASLSIYLDYTIIVSVNFVTRC